MKNKKTTQLTYAQLIERLETLLEAMEEGELPLEESLETFAECIQLIKQGENILAQADQRVEQLLAAGGCVPLSASKPTHTGTAGRGEEAGSDEA